MLLWYFSLQVLDSHHHLPLNQEVLAPPSRSVHPDSNEHLFPQEPENRGKVTAQLPG